MKCSEFEKSQFEKNQKDAEMVQALIRAVDDQVYGDMDWIRARAYWKTLLPMIVADFSTDVLAEALADALCRVHATRSGPDRLRYGLPR